MKYDAFTYKNISFKKQLKRKVSFELWDAIKAMLPVKQSNYLIHWICGLFSLNGGKELIFFEFFYDCISDPDEPRRGW